MNRTATAVIALFAVLGTSGCVNLNAKRVYQIRIVDGETGVGVAADPQVDVLTNIEYFTAPAPYSLRQLPGQVGGFEWQVRWPAVELYVNRASSPSREWPYQAARVVIDRRKNIGVVVESPLILSASNVVTSPNRTIYPIDEKGVIVVPLFRKPAAGAEGSATQPMTGEAVPAGGDR